MEEESKEESKEEDDGDICWSVPGSSIAKILSIDPYMFLHRPSSVGAIKNAMTEQNLEQLMNFPRERQMKFIVALANYYVDKNETKITENRQIQQNLFKLGEEYKSPSNE